MAVYTKLSKEDIENVAIGPPMHIVCDSGPFSGSLLLDRDLHKFNVDLCCSGTGQGSRNSGVL